MYTLLIVDDDIVDFNPGDFSHIVANEHLPFPTVAMEFGDGDFPENSYNGPLGYCIRSFAEVGFSVITATGARQAMELLKTSTLDVIVLDIMMPFEPDSPFDEEATAGGLRTGFKLAEEIHQQFPNTPIWILSNIVPGQDSQLNQYSANDLRKRGIVAGIKCKLDVTDNFKQFSQEIYKSLGR